MTERREKARRTGVTWLSDDNPPLPKLRLQLEQLLRSEDVQ
jgi:hypothetical protein